MKRFPLLRVAVNSLMVLGIAIISNAEPSVQLEISALSISGDLSIIEKSGDEWIRDNVVSKLGDIALFDLLMIELESSSPHVVALSESKKIVVCYSKLMVAPDSMTVNASRIQAILKEARELINSSNEKMIGVDKSEEMSYCLLVRHSREGPIQWTRADIRNPPKDGRLKGLIGSLELFWRPIEEELAEPAQK